MNSINKRFPFKKVSALILCLPLLIITSMGPVYAATAPKKIIQKLTSIFENSTTDLNYTYCENIGDGRGLTFGFPGFCSGTFDGTMFLKEYKKISPSNKLAKYIPAFEKIDSLPHEDWCSDNTEGLDGFAEDLASLENDADFELAQHNVVDSLYWNPSQELVATIGAKYNITKGEMYDSFINHGEDGALKMIEETNDTMGGTPKSGIDEKKWLEKYLSIRYAVLDSDPTWKEAVDRVHVYQKILEEGNVNLDTPISVTCYGDNFTIQQESSPNSSQPTIMRYIIPIAIGIVVVIAGVVAVLLLQKRSK